MTQLTIFPGPVCEPGSNNYFSMRLYSLLACIVVLGLSACAQAPKKVEKKEAPPLVFPLPPDDPRFIYERTIRSSRDVDTTVLDSTFEDILTGGKSSENNVALRKPYAVAVHQGRIFVSEPTGGVVRVFDVPGKKFFTIGNEEPGRLAMPIGLDVDGAGNLYVADATAKAIMVYDREGTFLRKMASAKIGEPPLFKRLASVAVDKKGERMYVVDIGGTVTSSFQDHRVRVFDAQTGAHLFDIGKRGGGDGEFNLARDAAIGKDNNLYVVDGGNFRVQIFDSEGKFLRKFGGLSKQLGNFSRPKEIALDPANNIYVVDTSFSNFQIFAPDGNLLMAIGSGSDTDTPAQYKLISGIAVDEDGRVYVVDQMFKKVDIFRPATVGPQDGYLGGKNVKSVTSGKVEKSGKAEQSGKSEKPVLQAPDNNPAGGTAPDGAGQDELEGLPGE